jgi:hypothetical protein
MANSEKAIGANTGRAKYSAAAASTTVHTPSMAGVELSSRMGAQPQSPLSHGGGQPVDLSKGIRR